jgi:RNA-directed DNA polymerase
MCHSISLAIEKQQNAENKYTDRLFERSIDRNNLNEAFKRVRANSNAHQAILKCKGYMDKGYKWAVFINKKLTNIYNHDL